MRSSIGAASDEAGSFGANAEALGGRWENLATTMGEVFAPALGAAMGGLGDLLKWVQDLWVSNRDSVFSWASGVAESMGFATEGTDILSAAVGYLGSAWDAMGLGFKFVQSYITDGIGYLIDGLAKLAGAFDYIVEKMGGTSTGLGDFLQTYAEDLHRLSGEQYKAFEGALIGPDSGRLMQESLQKTRDGIKAMQQELAAKPMELVANTGAKGTATKLLKEGAPYGSAVMAGSAEAAKAIARARLGSGATSVDKATKDTAANTKRSVVLQQKQVDRMDALLDKFNIATTVSM